MTRAQEKSTTHHGFAPVFDENSEILILGSFPSVKSRQNGFYYGNKQNRFWKMLEEVYGEKIEDEIEAKKSFVLKHKIALYDVVEESNLSGSADATLEKSTYTPSDISFLLPPHTKVGKILCNGKTAYGILTKNLKKDISCHSDKKLIKNQERQSEICGIPIFCMMSTSPANPRFSVQEWKEILTKD